jgi:N-acetylmuramic acid 6-phosphate etherase
VSRRPSPRDGARSGDLLTERRRPELSDIDLAPTDTLVALMIDESRTVADALEQASPAIVAAVDAVAGALLRGGRLIYVGAGTAGRLGVMDAAECGPTFSSPPGQVVGLLAGGADAFRAPAEQAEDADGDGAAAIDALEVRAGDVVVGITASGRTPYVLGAIDRARERGATTVGIACNPDAALSARVDHPVETVVGPELIAGSTRLKAGTAQKLVLNMLSTISMIRLGRTFGNLMVEVRATNEKLRSRAVRIVEEATGADHDAAHRALSAADGEIKVAILMVLRDVGAAEARRRLEAAGSQLRAALELG